MTTSEILFSALTSVNVPSRTVLHSSSPDGSLPKHSIYHFDDIRDAISMVLKSLRKDFCRISTSSSPDDYLLTQPPPLILSLDHWTIFDGLKMNQLFEVKDAMFACSVTSENALLDSNSDGNGTAELPSASVMVTITFDTDEPVSFDIVDPLIAEIERNFTKFGPILARSTVKRDINSGTIFKYFAEFYRVQDCKLFMTSVGSVSTDHAEIKFEQVSLYDVDREALFFAPQQQLSNVPSGDLVECHTRRDSIGSASNDEISSFSSFDANFEIDLWKIESGLEKRTTCMIRNIPNKYTQQMVLDMVNETHRGCFDFLYLRMDFRNRCNVGYAFINFTDPKHIMSFSKRVCGKRWARFNSDKICTLTFARIQGTQALIDKFRHSKVMFEAPAYRPKLFFVSGPLAGQEAPFPGCDFQTI